MKILVVPCLFLCAIFKHPAFQWIAAGALALWVCFMLAEAIRPRIRKRKNPTVGQKQEATKEHQELPTLPTEADDDTKLSLLRQVNHRVMEQLKQSYPTVAWLWEARPSSEEISKGCTKRIKLYRCDPFNFGEVTLSATGKLEIALVQMVPLAEAELQPHNDEDLEEQDILETFFQNTMWKDHKLNKGEKGTSFLVDENLKFKICPNEERRRNAETIYARHKIEIGHGNEIPIWLFGFLY